MGILSLILDHPEDIPALLRVRYLSALATRLPSDPHLAFCYDMLNRVSRSFAIVIQQLDQELRDAVCIFYLVLRALDTVEDDMSIQDEVKLPILRSFHSYIYDPKWKFVCGEKDYRRLMENSFHMSTAFLGLKTEYQDVIADICKRMGAGMAKFITTDVETIAQYEEYCGYVAGLVGVGLTDLFENAKLEDPSAEALSYSMGLFLQKTNIIRDYLEDIMEVPAPRMFWPKEIWGKYAKSLEELKDEPLEKSVRCLNEMVTDALCHATDCLVYMRRIRTPSIFRFCAIPQIMAIGTLALCYNNTQVFRGVVKMRKGLSARVMDGTMSMADVYAAFHAFAKMLAAKIDPSDPNASITRQRVDEICRTCEEGGIAGNKLSVQESHLSRTVLLLTSFLVIVLFVLLLLGGTSENRQ